MGHKHQVRIPRLLRRFISGHLAAVQKNLPLSTQIATWYTELRKFQPKTLGRISYCEFTAACYQLRRESRERAISQAKAVGSISAVLKRWPSKTKRPRRRRPKKFGYFPELDCSAGGDS